MAHAASMQTPPGNPEFLKLDDKYKCQKCHGVVRESMQTMCGHRLCQNCVEEMFKDGADKVMCPANDEDCLEMKKSEVFPDPSGRREVTKLPVYCTFKPYGCPKNVPWKYLAKHEKECDFLPVDCPNKEYGCTEKVSKVTLASHSNVCKYKLVACQYCEQSVPFINMEEHHKSVCPSVEVPCPNQCGSPSMRRGELENHLEHCPNRQYKCKFEVIGCDFMGTEKDVTEHVLNDTNRHLERITIFSNNIDIQNLETRRKLQEVTAEKDSLQMQVIALQQENTKIKTDIQALKDANKDMKMKMVGMTERIITLERRSEGMSNRELAVRQENEVQNIKTTITALRTQVNQLERQGPAGASGANPQEMEDVKRKVNLHEQQFGHLDVQLAELDLRFQILETASYDGVLLWKIRDYQRRKQEAVSGKTLSLYSQPFYTHRHGYRMCARVYLNGDGLGKGTHLSLFFVVMRGDYDNLLEWPFKHKVTMTLLDQENGQRHLSDTFRPDPNSSSFKKPTSDMNIASGCPLFVAHTVLETSVYLQDDTLFIKMEIDISQIKHP